MRWQFRNILPETEAKEKDIRIRQQDAIRQREATRGLNHSLQTTTGETISFNFHMRSISLHSSSLRRHHSYPFFLYIFFFSLCWCSKEEEYAISYISYMYDIVCLYTSFFRMKRTTAELARSRRRTPRRPGKRRRTSTGSRRSNCPLGMP